MAINFSTGFDLRTTEPIDRRFVLFKSEMFRERYLDDTVIPLPPFYMCVCRDDLQVYTYCSENPIISGIGRFRPLRISLPHEEKLIKGNIYDYIHLDEHPVQVQSAIEDGEGNIIADSLANKQNKLTPGTNIIIENNTISAVIPSNIISQYYPDNEGIINYDNGAISLLKDIAERKAILFNDVMYVYLKEDTRIDKTLYRTIDFQYDIFDRNIDINTIQASIKFIAIEFHRDIEPRNTYAQIKEYEGSIQTSFHQN